MNPTTSSDRAPTARVSDTGSGAAPECPGPVDLTRAAWDRDLPDTVEMIEVTARFTAPPQQRRMAAQVTVCPYLVVVADLRRGGGGFTSGFTALQVPTGLLLPGRLRGLPPMSPWVAADAAARVAGLDWSHPDPAYYSHGGPGAGHARAWVAAARAAAAADGVGVGVGGGGGGGGGGGVWVGRS